MLPITLSHTSSLAAHLQESSVVNDDDRVILIFLESISRKSINTIRAYEKECWRFLLWLRAKKNQSTTLLPLVSIDDANQYLNFLSSPCDFPEVFLKSQGWTHQPFRKPLSETSLKHSATILYCLFDALREIRAHGNVPYCLFNPFKLAHAGATKTSNEEIEQAFSHEEFSAILQAIESLPRKDKRDHQHYHRCRWVIQLLYRSFLRREEAAALKMSDFEPSPDGWSLSLTGKGRKRAKIIATPQLMSELSIYRISLGLSALPSPSESLPAISRIGDVNKSVTAQAIYLMCKVIFERSSMGMELHQSMRMTQASPHWLRHTGISHAMEHGINPRYVQAQARHSSLKITARYDHKDRLAWREDFLNFENNARKNTTANR